VSGIYNALGFLAPAVAYILKGIHTALATFLPAGSGWAWGLSVVFLTMFVRILLFPLFVKQIKSQRRMQQLAPQVKALQTKHKGDRETLNTELMKLYKDNGTNPISGCLPLLLQMPVFIALFRVMNEFKPKNGVFSAPFGLSTHLIEQGAKAKVFGAPLASSFNSSAKLLGADQLNGNLTVVRVVCVVMIVVMGGTTFWTQRQLMARNGAPTDPQQAQIQKIMLYVLPLFFAVAGVNFPVGVLLYWLTTNVWSMGQQAWVIKHMPPVTPGGATPGASKPTDPKGPKDGGKGSGPKDAKGPKGGSNGDATSGDEPQVSALATASKPTPPKAGQRPASGRASGSRKNKNRKGGRR
jgi:YidC/Oxa1 family membrane protein insertase